MSDNGTSLKALLLGEPPSAAISASVGAATAALKAGLIDLPRIDWRQIASGVSDKVEEMFEIRLSDVLAGAWRDYRELRECADPAKHSADEIISLPLVDHSIETTFRPYLEVVIGNRPPMRVGFEITIELELHGVTLKIEDAIIRSIYIGTCRAAGSVKCEGVALIERKTRELELPGEIELQDGIPIGPLFVPGVSRRGDHTATRPSEVPFNSTADRDARIVTT